MTKSPKEIAFEHVLSMIDTRNECFLMVKNMLMNCNHQTFVFVQRVIYNFETNFYLIESLADDWVDLIRGNETEVLSIADRMKLKKANYLSEYRTLLTANDQVMLYGSGELNKRQQLIRTMKLRAIFLHQLFDETIHLGKFPLVEKMPVTVSTFNKNFLYVIDIDNAESRDFIEHITQQMEYDWSTINTKVKNQ